MTVVFSIRAQGVIYDDIRDKIIPREPVYGLGELSHIKFPLSEITVEASEPDNPALRAAVAVMVHRVKRILENMTLGGEPVYTANNVPELVAVLLAATLKARLNPAVVLVRWQAKGSGWGYKYLGDVPLTFSELADRYFFATFGILGEAIAAQVPELFGAPPINPVAIPELSSILAWVSEAIRQLSGVDPKYGIPLARVMLRRIRLILKEIANTYISSIWLGLPNNTIIESFEEALQAAMATGDRNAVEFVKTLREAYETIMQTLRSMYIYLTKAVKAVDSPGSPDQLKKAAELLEKAAAEARKGEAVIEEARDYIARLWERLERKARRKGPFLVGREGRAAARA